MAERGLLRRCLRRRLRLCRARCTECRGTTESRCTGLAERRFLRWCLRLCRARCTKGGVGCGGRSRGLLLRLLFRGRMSQPRIRCLLTDRFVIHNMPRTENTLVVEDKQGWEGCCRVVNLLVTRDWLLNLFFRTEVECHANDRCFAHAVLDAYRQSRSARVLQRRCGSIHVSNLISREVLRQWGF